MIPLSAEESMDVRDIIVPAMSYGRHTVTFTRDVEVKTRRVRANTFDGVQWYGILKIQEGETIPVRHTIRGHKQRPCRLNELSIPTTEFELNLVDVPEDSYVSSQSLDSEYPSTEPKSSVSEDDAKAEE